MQTTLVTLNQSRAKRRALARRGVAPEPIEIPARQTPPVQLPEGADPLLDAVRVCFFLGGISPMSLHRWTGKRNFPLPDLRIGQRRFWRLSSVERWIQSQIVCLSIIGIILVGVAGFGAAVLLKVAVSQSLQAEAHDRANIDDIYRVRDPLRSLAETRVTVGPPALNLRAVTVQGGSAAASGQALPWMEQVAARTLPPPSKTLRLAA
jgi:hypothetical protein